MQSMSPDTNCDIKVIDQFWKNDAICIDPFLYHIQHVLDLRQVVINAILRPTFCGKTL